MIWTFGHFEFNADTRVLSTASGEMILEPKVSSLLYYFCQHPQKNISREELFTEVWHGQLVTDNAINRVIALLRKALGDENKIKQYIVTVPKIGYRFIAIPIKKAVVQQEDLSIEKLSSAVKITEREAINREVKQYKDQQRLFLKVE